MFGQMPVACAMIMIKPDAIIIGLAGLFALVIMQWMLHKVR